MADNPLDTYIKSPPPQDPVSHYSYLEDQLQKLETVNKKQVVRIEANTSSLTEERLVRSNADNAIAQYVTTASVGAARVYTQSSPPVSTGRLQGDVWYDTDDSFKPYVWYASAWQDNSAGGYTQYVGQIASISTTLAATNNKVDNTLGVQWAVKATINGSTGGLTFTGIQRADGTGATYNLEINSNVTINGGLIVAGSISGSSIAAGTITGANIAAGSINADRISAGTITADRIVAGSIETTRLADGAVSNAKIANSAVDTNKISANSVSYTGGSSNSGGSSTVYLTGIPGAVLMILGTFDGAGGQSGNGTLTIYVNGSAVASAPIYGLSGNTPVPLYNYNGYGTSTYYGTPNWGVSGVSTGFSTQAGNPMFAFNGTGNLLARTMHTNYYVSGSGTLTITCVATNSSGTSIGPTSVLAWELIR